MHASARYPDVLIYTAKGTEFEVMKEFLRSDKGVNFASVGGDHRSLLEGTLNGIRIVLASGSRQGPEVCAATVMGLLHLLNPRRTIMVGMYAGNPQKYKLGEALMGIAATNIGEGKVTGNGELEADNRTVNAHESSSGYADRLEKSNLAKKVTFMSGSAVVENSDIPWGTKGRDSHAYDMEASAFLTAIEHYNSTSELKVIGLGVCKGVADTGDAASRNVNKMEKQEKGVRAAALAVVAMLWWIQETESATFLDAANAFASASKSLKDSKEIADFWKSKAIEALKNHPETDRVKTGLLDSAYLYVGLTSDKRDAKRWSMASVCKLFPQPPPEILVQQGKADEETRETVASVTFFSTDRALRSSKRPKTNE